MVRSLGIALDTEDATPIYQQIARQIRDRIQQGALPAGFRLPPTRSLAEGLSTHRNTVVRAFEELAAAGYVHSVVGRGTFVSDGVEVAQPRPPAPARAFPWQQLMSSALDSERLGHIDRLSRGSTRGDLINLTQLQPSDDLLPHDELRRCMDHVLRTLGPKALRYAPRQGLPQLRQLIADDLARNGVPASPDDLVITTGSQQAIDLIARALVNPGDTFLTEGQTYAGALNALATSGARIVGVPSDDEGPDMAATRALARGRVKGLYLIPNCRNPTGTTMSERRRRELIAWSHEAGVPIIEDDYGADLGLDPSAVAPPAMRALDANVFHVGTYSKKLIPALRVGFIVSPAPLTPHLVHLKRATDLGTSVLLQHALAEFLDRGYLRTHLKRTIPAYRARRDALVAALRAHLPDAVEWDVPRHGVIMWLRLPDDLDAEVLFEEAKRRGVLVSPDLLYIASGAAQRGVRLTFCSESPERLTEGARRLGRAVSAVMADRPAFARSRRPAATLDLV